MASVWNWAIGYLLVFAALQFAVYVYYRRRMDDEASPQGPGGEQPTVDQFAARSAFGDEATGSDVRPCPHCGVGNEPDSTFRYCRNCARQLAGS
ncbi:DUF7577 domain-containing protein [Haloarchaeobius sp. HRN-SO-5]|uniref:DUF7577 domain-containing protein n=1 Tax=Haloarchaeobius sp. HRN-SO-5 TaxID=3446118 RepID=UPI003EBC0BC9